MERVRRVLGSLVQASCGHGGIRCGISGAGDFSQFCTVKRNLCLLGSGAFSGTKIQEFRFARAA